MGGKGGKKIKIILKKKKMFGETAQLKFYENLT